MAPAPALPATRPARSHPPEARRLSLSMRTALGFLHAGALFLQGRSGWRSRAFPEERVLDRTVRSLETMRLARLQDYEGLHGIRRVCAVITPEGMSLYRGGRLANRRPPPVAAEGVLCEVEQAMDAMEAEAAGLRRAMTDAAARMASARDLILRGEREMNRINERLRRIEDSRARLATCRQDLRAFTDQACERLGAELAEAGR